MFGTKIDLIVVALYFKGSGAPSVYVIASSELERFKKATLESYYQPGINPHNKEKMAELAKMTARRLEKEKKQVRPSGPYWWSTQGLQENNDPRGAKIYDGVALSDYAHLPEEVLWSRN